LGQALLAEEKYQEALKVYQRLSDLMPDDPDVYLRLGQIYRELHQMDKAEDALVKARQYSPGSLDVIYNEAMLYQSQGRFEDAIRVLSEAVTQVKGQPASMPSRRRFLGVLYQQLGQLYRDTQNYAAAANTYEELGHLGDDEDRRARLLMMDTYRMAKDLPKAMQVGKEALAKYPKDPEIKSNYALLLGESNQTDEAVRLLHAQLNGTWRRSRHQSEHCPDLRTRAPLQGRRTVRARRGSGSRRAPRQRNGVVSAGRHLRAPEVFRQGRSRVQESARREPQERGRAQLLRLYARRPRHPPRRSAIAGEARAGGRSLQRRVPRQPRLDLLQTEQAAGCRSHASQSRGARSPRPDHSLPFGRRLCKIWPSRTGLRGMGKVFGEWKRVLPADVEPEKVAEVEKKVSQSKHRVAQKSLPESEKP
jgi:Flp pilus assembly protein TadD